MSEQQQQSSSLWAWRLPANRPMLEAFKSNATFLKNAVLISDSVVSWGFGIGIFANKIGFAIGKLLVQGMLLACLAFGAPAVGGLAAAALGATLGATTALLCSGLCLSAVLLGAVLGATAAAGINHWCFSWGALQGALRVVQEVVAASEMVTMFSLSLARVVTQLCLRGIYQTLHLADHVELAALLPGLAGTCASVLMSGDSVRACMQVGSMIGSFTAQLLAATHVDQLATSLSLIRSAHQHSAAPPAGEQHTLQDHPRCAAVGKHVRYACACYGHQALKFLGVLPYAEGASCDESAFLLCSGCDQVLAAQWGHGLCAPGFVLAVDHSASAVVLSIRGSLFPADFLTDLLCEPVPVELLGQHGTAHTGMHRSAMQLSSAVLPTVTALLRSHRYSSYSLIVVGHSLGAGIAAILTAHWLSHSTLCAALGEQHNRLQGVGFGTPRALSVNLALTLMPHFTSFVIGNDVVPRFRSFNCI
eukprot:TRINITY_DN4805_c0_g1_i5.p1 TRINITY_DN4805_c0_g1~~TRINITY_DN4805_c0_g1_i5.p1  ORF type:complete len:476 (-),score=120.87 TRINITY_DN4805_c0_g1_i5:594-2021(-)